MMYLIFPTAGDALARSAQAWLDCGYAAGGTLLLWACAVHPVDGRAAMAMPATPAEAQIGISQESYDGLLTSAERAARVAAPPGGGWTPPDA